MSNIDDDEFDDLDDLLDDFQDEILSKPPGSTIGNTSSTNTTSNKENVKAAEQKEQLANEPEIDESELIKNLLSDLSSNDPELSANLNSFLKDLTKTNEDISGSSTGATSQSAEQNDTGKPANFKDLISDTVNRIKTSGEQVDQSLKTETQDDELLSTLLKSLDIGLNDVGGEGGSQDLSNLLVEMLEKLASKDVLHEPLNDLYLKFPSWLANNKNDPKIDTYTSQYNVIKSILDRFDDVNYNDSNEADRGFISTKLEELQELGMPPKEIANDDLGFLNFKDGKGDLDLTDEDIPEDIGKELEETCKQT